MSRTHPKGRHRIGIEQTGVPRRFWDGQARGAARRLDERWQGWIVMYGMGSRPVPRGRRLAGAGAAHPVRRHGGELEKLMYEAEMALIRREALGRATS
ncbi:hypothetical protein [Microtetraspora sp. NBRC 16547]|uniref:hypothetical protein n=1 Tax=Microtetraspora sp. NBRC 16547 TaxID=3030993 RepID=UPI0024A53F2A|nr:hypothetical protein [Microtetraspora sp. NBRC 16547]GLX00277.1 hypothetical protein Misp02_43630 [Microtetraspora sp. NBRC 16547]